MKIIAFTIYVLILIIACVLVGWWTLIPGIGIPVLYVGVCHVLFPLSNIWRNDNHRTQGRQTAIAIAKIDTRTEESHRQAVFAAEQLGVKIMVDNCYLTKPLFELSNEYLGRFLAHLLDLEYSDTAYRSLADSIREKRPEGILAILEPIQRINPPAAERLQGFLGS